MGQGGGCGLCYVKGQPKSEWTCPCGRGYWDAVKQEFINGARVGRREARTRADYEAHLRQCPECNAKAQQDDLILPILDRKEWDRKGYGTGSRPFVEQLPARNRQSDPRDLNEYFLPEKDIKFTVIANNIKRYLGPSASVRRGLHPDGRSGFLIRANSPLTVSMITELKTDSNTNRDPHRSSSVSPISSTRTELERPAAFSRMTSDTFPESQDSPEYSIQGPRYRESAQRRRQEDFERRGPEDYERRRPEGYEHRRQEDYEPRDARTDPPSATYGSNQSDQAVRGPSPITYRSSQTVEQGDLAVERVQGGERTVREGYREPPSSRRITSPDRMDPSRSRERTPFGQYRYEAERQVPDPSDPPHARERDAPVSRTTIPVVTDQGQGRATGSREQIAREIMQRLRAAGQTQITRQQLDALVDQAMERIQNLRR